MSPRPPLRFLLIVVGLWIGGRAAWLWPGEPVRTSAGRTVAFALPPMPEPAARRPVGVLAATSTRLAVAPAVRRQRPEPGVLRIDAALRPAPGHAPPPTAGLSASEAGTLLPGAVVLASADPIPPASASSSRRVSGYAYVYVRPGGGGASLGPGGQLGASQAGARVAWHVAPHVALAARLSAPLDRTVGAEGAVGIDLLPISGAPLRLSVERRVALGRDGRDAWSAYAAGGVYRALGRGLEVDGYAQAGVVGGRARDLFADGALRAGRRFALGAERALVVGAGAWGAAQPGAARLDVGPRAALSLPLDAVRATLALEARLRVAGRARPGSGVALTLAADF